MLKWHISMLPQISLASHVTSVSPTGKWFPDMGLQVTIGLSPELSVASGCCQTAIAVGCPGLPNNAWLPGQTSNVGTSLSKPEHRI